MHPVMLIPGNMCDKRLWRPVAERMARAGHDVRHAPPLVQSSIAAMADAVAAEIDRPAILIGFSMGAIVAAELARRAPDLVRGLGLVAFNASGDLPERAARRPLQQEAVRSGQLEGIIANELKPNYLADANRHDRHLLDEVMAMGRAGGPDVFIAQSEALRLRDDLRPALAALDMPVLLACGTEDRLCPPEWHRRWAAMIGDNAAFIEIPAAGHLLPLEQPDAMASALLDWANKDFP